MRSIGLALSVATLSIGAVSMAWGQTVEHNMAAMELPEKCRQADSPQMPGMAEMDMSGMDEAQQANMQAMMNSQGPMMQGMMAKDPDVAFACGMIAHHQGAIDMSEVELEHGDNDQMKQMAQKIIEAQKKEIAEFTTWLESDAN